MCDWQLEFIIQNKFTQKIDITGLLFWYVCLVTHYTMYSYSVKHSKWITKGPWATSLTWETFHSKKQAWAKLWLSSSRYHLPLEGVWSFIWTNLNPVYPNTFSRVWCTLALWFWKKMLKIINEFSLSC